MRAIGGSDEQCGEADAIARFAHGTFDDRQNSKVRATTLSPGTWTRALMISSANPWEKYSCSLLPLMLAKVPQCWCWNPTTAHWLAEVEADFPIPLRSAD